jgi:hypothetical protein
MKSTDGGSDYAAALDLTARIARSAIAAEAVHVMVVAAESAVEHKVIDISDATIANVVELVLQARGATPPGTTDVAAGAENRERATLPVGGTKPPADIPIYRDD